MQREIYISFKHIMENFVALIDNTLIFHMYCGQIIRRKTWVVNMPVWSGGMIQSP